MPTFRMKALLLALALGIAPGIGWANEPDTAKSISDILDCVRENGPERTMKQRLKLQVHDRAGDVQTMKANLLWKLDDEDLSRLLIRLSAPPDLRGAAFLMLEEEGGTNMFAYLPELKMVRRVTGRHSEGSVFGSDFSYEDMQHLYRMAQVESSKRLDDEDVSGRPAWVIETTRESEEESAYSRTLSYIDQETCVMLKGTFFGQDGAVRKTLLANPDELEKEGDVWIPRHVRIEDLRTATHSELTVEKVEFDVEISDRKFTKSALESRGR